MSENTNDQAGGNDQSNASGGDGSKKDVVSYETFQELLGQRKKDQEKARELEKKLKEFEEKEAQSREAKMREEGNFKALLDDREKELSTLKEQLADYAKQVQTYEQTFTDTKKINAFNKAIGGKLKMDDYYKFVDTSKIAIDPESGKVDDSSVNNYAKEFVSKFKDLVEYRQGSLPDQAATTSGKLTLEQWQALAAKNPAEARLRMKDVQK